MQIDFETQRPNLPSGERTVGAQHSILDLARCGSLWSVRILLLGIWISLNTAVVSIADPTWIHFDNVPAGTWITNQFAAEGVHLVNDYASGQTYQSAPQVVTSAQARTSPNVLINRAFDEEIHTSRNVPLVLWFDQPVSGVGMQLGFVGSGSKTLTATVRLYDCEGSLRGSATNSPRADFMAPLQVLDPTGTSRTVTIDYGDSGTPEAIDDLAFEVSGNNCISVRAPSVTITSHTNNQVLIQTNILLEGTVHHESGIIQEVAVNGQFARLTPQFTSNGVLFYRFSIPLQLKDGHNTVAARAVGGNGKIASQIINLGVGAPTSVQLVNFHLTQRGLMRTNSPCDVDAPLVAGKFTIVRAQFEARTASNAETYIDGVLMSLSRRVNNSPVLVDEFWGELYSPQTVNFSSASDLAGVHFWIPASKVDLAGEYSMTFQPYVGSTKIGPPLEVPCANRWFAFAETKPVRLLILPVEAQLFDPNLLPEDHDRVFDQLEYLSRLYPVRDGYSSLWNSEKTGIKFTYTMPHPVCDGGSQSVFCKGTGFEWRFKDTDPSGLWRPQYLSVVDPSITTCLNDSIIGGRISSTTLTNLPARTKFGLFTPGTPSEWESRRFAWPLDDNHNGTIDDDLPNYVAEFLDQQTGQWLTDLSQYDHGETFRSYVDANGNYCHDKESEPKLPMHRKWDNVVDNLLWAPAKKTFKDYNAYVSKIAGGAAARADYAVLWFPQSFHPMDTRFHQFDPGSGLVGGAFSWITPGDFAVLAHEVGHNFGLDHANDPPPAWQAYARHQQVNPSLIYSNMRDTVGSPNGAFFRDSDYLSVFRKLTNGVTAGVARSSSGDDPPPTLSLEAVLDPLGQLVFADFSRTTDAAPSEPDPDSPFRLRLGVRDRVLSDLGVPFHAAVQERWSTGELMVLASFAAIWPEETGWIELVPPAGETVRHFVSDQAPVVELRTPNGGELVGVNDLLPVEWRAEDRNDDPLTYSLFYTPDGEQWLPIAVGLTEMFYVVDAGSLPGGQEARIRVVASDGFNEGEDASDEVFRVAGKIPVVRINQPAHGSQYLEWDSIPLEGVALDPEGKPVSATWYVDGAAEPVGSGFSWLLPPLPPGEHLVQLIIQDDDGYGLITDRLFQVVADSDRDGMSDDYEIAQGLIPSLAEDALSDPDQDGVTSFDEAWRGLQANNPDSDGDGVDDGTELSEGFDPLDANSFPIRPDPHFFVDTFDGPELHPALEDPANAFTVEGGEARANGPRNYVRTAASDYNILDFQAELIYRMDGGAGPAGLFFGLGAVEPDPGYFNEPLHSVYALDHAQDFFLYQGTAIRSLPISGQPYWFFDWAEPDTLIDGVHALRLIKQGDQLNWQMDHLYDDALGFAPTYSGTISLGDAPFLNDTGSHLFFGTDASPTRILELRVGPIAPSLTVTWIGNEVRVSWPLSAGPDWRLEASPHLTAPIPWTQVSLPYSTDATHYWRIEPVTTDNRFYRLHRN